MVLLAVFQNPDQAHLLSAHLRGMGIHTDVAGVYTAQNAPYLSALGGGVRVEVPPEEFDAALTALASMDLLAASPWTGVRCPSCGSLKVERTRDYAKDVPWFLFIAGLFLLGIPLLLRRKRLHCVDCGGVWRDT